MRHEFVADTLGQDPFVCAVCHAYHSFGQRLRCDICGRLLGQANDPTSGDCGGTCLKCMAAAGDLQCVEEMEIIAFQQARDGNWNKGI